MSKIKPKIKYFMPEWDDKYDPNFDYIKDEFSNQHKEDPKSDLYAHEILEDPPYDGILYSLGNLFNSIVNEKPLDQITARGFSNIMEYYRLYNSVKPLEVFGDCGAFNYINHPEPPAGFTPEKIAYLYNRFGFQYGVSLDHLVVETIKETQDGKIIKRNLTQNEKRKRIKISIDNAETFLNINKKENYEFIPVGSAQGYSPTTYRNSVASLVEMGYEYVALGGLVRRRTDAILEIIKAVNPVLKGKNLHLLGVIRPEYMNDFKQLGVTSVDSASYFRKAWLRSEQNYIAADGSKWYAALRVPIVKESRMVLREGISIDIKQMEKDCLKVLREYDKGLVSLEKTLDLLVEYDSLFLRNGNDGKNLRESYKKTLQEQPWKVCKCPICTQIGIEVLIFRRTNRNKRRGLHNTWVFYYYLNA